jgi:hypothetical protein
MRKLIGFAGCAVALSLGMQSNFALAGDSDQVQRACAQKTRATYGFQCQGTANIGYGASGATYVGTVTGSDSGYFTGGGTFTLPSGSISTQAAGQAHFDDASCFGHIQYQVTASGQSLGTLDVDFAVVNGGSEVLGTPNAWNGNPGSVLMTCRLVKIGRPD